MGTTRTDPFSDLDPGNTALFLDFDGTLAPIVARPDDARVEPIVLDSVRRLADLADGAVAIVSGRAVEQIDRLVAPLLLPVAGVHGLQRRDSAGTMHEAPIDRAALLAVAAPLFDFAGDNPGLIVEPKPASVALHYRQRPELEDAARALGRRCVDARPGLRLLEGKCVIEIKGGDRTKGDALADFMREPPFAGRRPVMAGDDVTDEAAFAAADERGGVSVKVGDGETVARHRLSGPQELHALLRRLAERWEGPTRP